MAWIVSPSASGTIVAELIIAAFGRTFDDACVCTFDVIQAPVLSSAVEGFSSAVGQRKLHVDCSWIKENLIVAAHEGQQIVLRSNRKSSGCQAVLHRRLSDAVLPVGTAWYWPAPTCCLKNGKGRGGGSRMASESYSSLKSPGRSLALAT